MQEMYPIAIPIDLKHKRKHKILYSHIEANTHDYMDMNFENKSGTYVRLCVHLPMEICTPLQFLLLQCTTQQKKKTKQK